MIYIYQIYTRIKPGKSNYSFSCIPPAAFQSHGISLCFQDAEEQARVTFGRLLCFKKMVV